MDTNQTGTEQKHLVIGAGFSGLGVMGAFARQGLPFDGVEAEEDLGGNWRHGVYETVHIISSRKTTQYAEHRCPRSGPTSPARRRSSATSAATPRSSGCAATSRSRQM